MICQQWESLVRDRKKRSRPLRDIELLAMVDFEEDCGSRLGHGEISHDVAVLAPASVVVIPQ